MIGDPSGSVETRFILSKILYLVLQLLKVADVYIYCLFLIPWGSFHGHLSLLLSCQYIQFVDKHRTLLVVA